MRYKRNMQLLCVMLFVSVPHWVYLPHAYGQSRSSVSAISFDQVVLEAMAARSAVSSGEFSYTMKFFTKDGDEYEWKKEGVFAFDDRTEQCLHSFRQLYAKNAKTPNPFGATPGDGIAIETEDGLCFCGGGVFTKDRSILYHPGSSKGTTARVSNREATTLLTPFDYRGFGFAFFGDVARGQPFDKVMGNYLLLKNSQVTLLKESDVPRYFHPIQKGFRYYNYGGCILAVDAKRDYWVTQSKFTTPKVKKESNGRSKVVGNVVQSSCTLYLTELNGHWVPERALYKSRDERLDFAIRWKSVNEPQGKIDFSAQRLSADLGKPLINIRVQ